LKVTNLNNKDIGLLVVSLGRSFSK